MTMPSNNSTVFIVEDDESIRDVITQLVMSVGLPAKSFKDPETFLTTYDASWAGCLILDIRLPRMSGLDLYETLKKRYCTLPTIFISAYADVPLAVRAIKAGAIDFIVKPFNNQLLLDQIQHAISLSSSAISKTQFHTRLTSLTRREKEVVELIVEGKTNKEIAHALHITCSTVELHRANLLSKLHVKNTAELIKNYWK